MELKLKISYSELLELIKQLPARQLAKLKAELSEDLIKEKAKKELPDEFYKLIMEGPVMTDEQYSEFLINRKRFSQWRMN